MVLKVSLNTGINRIRLEFKATKTWLNVGDQIVLIESDWNLKNMIFADSVLVVSVLIESDWNLK